jgi:chromate reductase
MELWLQQVRTIPVFGPFGIREAEVPVAQNPRRRDLSNLIGIAGSLRRGSFNAALLRAAAELVPDGSHLAVKTIHGIPLYDGDLEEEAGIPAVVTDLKDAIVASDGLLLVTPEYNNSVPGVFKNAIDWLSRPPSDIKRVFAAKPVAVAGASPGGFGTILSQNAWLPILRALGAQFWTGRRLLLSRARTVFNDRGELTDDNTKEQLRTFLSDFAEFARSQKRDPPA